jgi:hypothetical protein
MLLSVFGLLLLSTDASEPLEKVLIWDVDLSNNVTNLPPQILVNTEAEGGMNGGPGTGHGLAANLYNQGAFPPNNGAIPQLGNLSLHIAALKTNVPKLIPNVNFEGVCLYVPTS